MTCARTLILEAVAEYRDQLTNPGREVITDTQRFQLFCEIMGRAAKIGLDSKRLLPRDIPTLLQTANVSTIIYLWIKVRKSKMSRERLLGNGIWQLRA